MGNLLNGVQTTTLTKNTWALCATRHTVSAEATGAEAGKDNILVSYKLESTSGIGNDYHTKDGYLHKIRITIFKDGEIAYQQDVAGDDSGNFITLPPFLITGEGKWEITAKTIAAGDCAKPEGEKNFAYLYAKAPEPVEEEQEEDRAKTAQDLTPLLTVGMVGLAGLVFGKVLRGKRKEAETFEAKETPKYQQAMDFIHRIFYEPNSEEYKVFQQVKRVTQAPHSLWCIWDTYCYFNLRQTEQYQDLLKGGKNRLRANLGKCGRFREERELYSKYGVMNLQQFINAIAAAERKAQINIRVIGDGSRFFFHNGFVYITTGYDADVLWSKSSIFPDYSRQGKEKFKRLMSFQQKRILKAKAGRKDLSYHPFLLKEAETFEAQRRLNYGNMIYEAFYGDENSPTRKYVRNAISVDKTPFISSDRIWRADKSIANDYDMERTASAGLKKFLERKTGLANSNCFYIKDKLFLVAYNGMHQLIITSMDEAKPFITEKIKNSGFAERNLLISLLKRNKYDLFAKTLIQRNGFIALGNDAYLEQILRRLPKYDEAWLETQNPTQLQLILRTRAVSLPKVNFDNKEKLIRLILNSQ